LKMTSHQQHHIAGCRLPNKSLQLQRPTSSCIEIAPSVAICNFNKIWHPLLTKLFKFSVLTPPDASCSYWHQNTLLITCPEERQIQPTGTQTKNTKQSQIWFSQRQMKAVWIIQFGDNYCLMFGFLNFQQLFQLSIGGSIPKFRMDFSRSVRQQSYLNAPARYLL
jgi:hypothetical protein